MKSDNKKFNAYKIPGVDVVDFPKEKQKEIEKSPLTALNERKREMLQLEAEIKKTPWVIYTKEKHEVIERFHSKKEAKQFLKKIKTTPTWNNVKCVIRRSRL